MKNLFLIMLISSSLVAKPKTKTTKIEEAPQKSIPSGTEMVESFNFNNVDVMTLVKQISKLTGKRFIVDNKLAKKKGITIISSNPISVQEAYNVFLSVLSSVDLAVVRSGKFLKILPKKKISGGQNLYTGSYYPQNDEYVTRVVKLKHINATNLKKILSGKTKSILGRKIKMQALEETNTLIVTATGTEIKTLEEIVGLLDVKGYEYQMEIIPILHADADNVKKILENVLFKKATSKKMSSGVERYLKVFPDTRTNSLVVLANAPGIKKVRKLVRKLDFEIKGGSNVHVYKLKNARAEDLAKTLSSLLSKKNKNNNLSDIIVTADKWTNALVVRARPKEYDMLISIIDQLDGRKGQVMFETITMEVSVNNDSSFGISSNYALSPEIPRAVGFDPQVSSQNNIMNFLTNPGVLTGMILGFGTKDSIEVNLLGQTLRIPSLSAFVTALEKNSYANVLQRPTVITADNEEAIIKVVDKIPVVTGTSVTATGISQQNIQRLEVGLKLKIIPRINAASDFVKLDIEQDTSNLTDKAPRDLSGTSVATNNRKIKTSVIVHDKDTVIIGGLYRDDVNVTYNKVPILGDIPILGWLFKGKTTRREKTNLLVFITPHIIRDNITHSKLTLQKIKERKAFIKLIDKEESLTKQALIQNIEKQNKMNLKRYKLRNSKNGVAPIEFKEQ